MVLNGIRTLHQKKTRRPPCTHPLLFITPRHLTTPPTHPNQTTTNFFPLLYYLSLVHSDWTFYLLTFFSLHTYSHLANSSHHLRSTESLTFKNKNKNFVHHFTISHAPCKLLLSSPGFWARELLSA